MTELAYPFGTGGGSGMPDQFRWSNMLRGFPRGGDGVWKTADTLYDLGRCAVFADSTGMRVKLPSGRATIWSFQYVNDAEKILTIAAADATNPRIDRVVLELDTTLTDNQIVSKVITGTPAASPVAPTLTTSATKKQLSLAQVRVNASVSTIAAGNVTDERPFLLSGLTPGCVVRRTANQTIPHASQTSVVWSVADVDNDGCSSGGGFTCKTPGWYDLKASIEWATTQPNGLRIAYLQLARVGVATANIAKDAMTATAGETAQNLAATVALGIGDVVSVALVQSNAATASLDVLASSLASPRLSAVYVGP